MPADVATALSRGPDPERRPARAGLVPAAASGLLLALAAALSYLSISCWSVILPGWVLGRLHGSSVDVGWIMGLTPASALLLRSAAGGLGDRLGRRGPALAGAALLALGSLILLAPASLSTLVISRLLLGVGDALFATAIMAWAVEGVAPERHGRTLATLGMGIWLGTALAPLWATFAREHGGYTAVWVGAGAAATLAGVTVALVRVGAGLGRVGAPPDQAAAVPELAATGPGLMARPTDHAALAPDRAAPGLRRLGGIPRGALVPAAVMLCAAYGDGVFSGFGIVHLRAAGISAAAASSVFSVMALTTLLGRFAGGTLADRSSPRRLAMLALVLLAGGYAVLALAGSFPVAIAGAALVGLGLALAYPALGVLVSTQVSPERRGAGFGFFLASLDLAFGLGPALGGLIVAASSTTVALLSGCVVALLGLRLLRER